MMIQLADAIATGPFPIVVEIVASGVKREAQVLEVASDLANIPAVAAGSIASYVDGKPGQDPLRVAAAVRARGLVPNIHLTCVSRDKVAMRQTLHEMRALGLVNVFALTGDRRVQGDPAYAQREAEAAPGKPEFDSVRLTEMIAQLRTTEGTPFHISVAVSPFVYTRDECLAQYQRLERKIAAGANLAITQAGWDARKFAELKRFVSDRGLQVPLLGNVHVLTRRAAEQMTAAHPNVGADFSRHIPTSLLDVVRRESDAADGGQQARLERAAKTVAVLKGLGYAGAYITGTSSADHVAEILHRASECEKDWQRCADDLQYSEPGGFYLEAASIQS
jgi:methylenetetrahydrofolate reductase (NADPH)